MRARSSRCKRAPCEPSEARRASTRPLYTDINTIITKPSLLRFKPRATSHGDEPSATSHEDEPPAKSDGMRDPRTNDGQRATATSSRPRATGRGTQGRKEKAFEEPLSHSACKVQHEGKGELRTSGFMFRKVRNIQNH